MENNKEVIRIYSTFFDEPYNKQRHALRLVIWWAVKHYIKIINPKYKEDHLISLCGLMLILSKNGKINLILKTILNYMNII